MLASATPRTRPVLTLIIATLTLVVVLGGVGTASYAFGLTGYAPLAIAFIPLAAVLAIGLTQRRGWRQIGFKRFDRRPATIVALALGASLPVIVLATATGLSTGVSATLGFAGLALLVGFVEETIFRGILPRRFASPTAAATVALTSIAFAVAHSITVLSPDQSTAAASRTVVFAFLFGVIASLLVRLTGSIWPSIVLHATFDFAGFVLTPQSGPLTDTLTIAVALVVAVVLALLSRQRQPWLNALASGSAADHRDHTTVDESGDRL